MAANGIQRRGLGSAGAPVRLRAPLLASVSMVEEEALVEALALALLPLLAGVESRSATSGSAIGDGVEGGERGAGCDLLPDLD